MPVCALPGHEFVEVSGADSRKFLQGQVTCNVEQLSSTRSLPGAICNLQGRVIADFRLAWTGEACLLQTNTGMADTIIATLARYAVFSKVELRRLEAPLALGIEGNGHDAALAQLFAAIPQAIDDCTAAAPMCLLRIPGERLELWCLDKAMAAPLRDLLGEWRPSPGTNWHVAEIEAGEVHVGAATSGKYTPQLLNYDISGVVNFSKGCYTGQEVVARMHFRGKAKKRMFVFRGEQRFTPESRICEQATGDAAKGDAVKADAVKGEKPLSHVNRDGESNLALAIANIERAGLAEPFHLDGNPDAPLQATASRYDHVANRD